MAGSDIDTAGKAGKGESGVWLPVTNRERSYLFKCSACRNTAYFIGRSGKCAYPFCPNCGIRMDAQRKMKQVYVEDGE